MYLHFLRRAISIGRNHLWHKLICRDPLLLPRQFAPSGGQEYVFRAHHRVPGASSFGLPVDMRSMTAAPVTGATSPCAIRDMIQGARGSVLLPGRPLGPSTAIALPSTPCCFLRLSSPLAVGTFSAVYAAVALRPLGRSKGCVPGWTVTGCLAAGHSYDAAASSISRPCPCSAGT